MVVSTEKNKPSIIGNYLSKIAITGALTSLFFSGGTPNAERHSNINIRLLDDNDSKDLVIFNDAQEAHALVTEQLEILEQNCFSRLLRRFTGATVLEDLVAVQEDGGTKLDQLYYALDRVGVKDGRVTQSELKEALRRLTEIDGDLKSGCDVDEKLERYGISWTEFREYQNNKAYINQSWALTRWAQNKSPSNSEALAANTHLAKSGY